MEQVERKRGGFLSGWLIFLTVTNLMIFNILLFEFPEEMRPLPIQSVEGTIAVYSALVLLNVIFFVAAWQWKKWGVIGLSIMVVFFVVLSRLAQAHIHYLIIGIVGLVVLIILIFPIWHCYRWIFYGSSDDAKTIETPPFEKKRGKGLSFWLIFLLIVNPIVLVLTFFYVFDNVFPDALLGIPDSIILVVLNIIFSRAAWLWKKWGVWGLGIMTVLAAVTSALSFYFFYLSPIEVVGIVFLIIKVLPVWHYFTWR